MIPGLEVVKAYNAVWFPLQATRAYKLTWGQLYWVTKGIRSCFVDICLISLLASRRTFSYMPMSILLSETTNLIGFEEER